MSSSRPSSSSDNDHRVGHRRKSIDERSNSGLERKVGRHGHSHSPPHSHLILQGAFFNFSPLNLAKSQA